MGFFSWCDCITQKPIMIGEMKPVYVLIPKQFGGGHIIEYFYDGYGRFGGKDIYELVADWNKGLYKDFKKFCIPTPKEAFGGLWEYEVLDLEKQGYSLEEIHTINEDRKEENFRHEMIRYERMKAIFEAFMSGMSDEELTHKYQNYEKREIGIYIAGENKNNRKLKYPIKITFDREAVYEDCKYSKIAKNQGCY